jgi:hypothetical protein
MIPTTQVTPPAWDRPNSIDHTEKDQEHEDSGRAVRLSPNPVGAENPVRTL